MIAHAAVEAEWRWARALTLDLLRACDESDLLSTVVSGISPLWKLFRHIGRVEENYLRAIVTKEIEFSTTDCQYTGGCSRGKLIEYFSMLGERHQRILTTVGASDCVIDWFGETLPLDIHLLRLISHETLHHGQLIVVWRSLGKTFPESWKAWGE